MVPARKPDMRLLIFYNILSCLYIFQEILCVVFFVSTHIPIKINFYLLIIVFDYVIHTQNIFVLLFPYPFKTIIELPHSHFPSHSRNSINV